MSASLQGVRTIFTSVKRILATLALLVGSAACSSASAGSKVHVVWWDFFIGGDGIRMKALVAQFNAEHSTIEIDPTTLQWGSPFYTKLQTAAAVGQGPDLMTYHISRLPLGVASGTLRPFAAADVKAMGLGSADFAPAAWQAAHVDGKLYAVPLDIHSIVLYFNKDLLKKAGLLGANGQPQNVNGLTNFTAAIKKLTGGGSQYGLSFASADGPIIWRIFYTLFTQQGGKFMNGDTVLPAADIGKAQTATDTMRDWIAKGYVPKLTDYPGSIALFTSGKAAMLINGVWEVPTMIDLAKKNKLGFDWGAVQIPVVFERAATAADSHAFAIPNRVGNAVPPDQLAADFAVIGWMERHSLQWAAAGHIPAFRPVTESAAFTRMQPNATYASLVKTAVFDPRSEIAGVASPIYEATANFIMPAANGQIATNTAISELRDELQGDLK